MTHSLTCRHCSAPLEVSFCDLGMSPLANSYIEPDALSRMERFYPLHTFVCSKCLLVQLQEFESPADIFGDYAYFSSYSESWLEHARKYVELVTERFRLGPASQVIEIASNDGYLLQYFVRKSIPVLGVEPAANVAKVAQDKGIPSRVAFFGSDTARKLVSEGLGADLLLGNNVLAHVPDLNDFVRGLKLALKSTGVITMEFPHLLQLMRENQFDTIYHEHFSYFSFFTVQKVFAHHGLRIFDVDQLPTHGGSLRIYAAHADQTAHADTERVAALLETERAAGLDGRDDLAAYRDFSERVKRVKRQLLAFLIEAKQAGKQVVGYGAPAKGNTLLNYCGVRTDFVDYTVDRSPHKQGRALPGVHIPIYHPDRIRESKPDYVLILPWNLRDEVMSQMAHVREWGGRFVVPIPELTIL
ncbi:MAG TPA: class I SAM-dependent methyltransferase [Polyangiales bacterium]|nr:class I SAM-dependent methyltransferase [Polyangiales bacterium]